MNDEHKKLIAGLEELSKGIIDNLTHEERNQILQKVLAQYSVQFMDQCLYAMRQFDIMTKECTFKIPFPFKDEVKDDGSHFLVTIKTELGEDMAKEQEGVQ